MSETENYSCNDNEVNNENVFEREINLCQDFQYYEETEDRKINLNVSSNVMTICVHYDNDWDVKKRTKNS